MLQDLNTWQPTLYKDILEWPIQLAYLMSLEKGNDNPLEKRDETDSEDIEEVPLISFSIVENEIKTNANNFKRTVWAKFKEFEDDDIKLQLPKGFFHTIEKSNITIQYGIKSTECQFIRNEETALLKDNSFYRPIEIFVSSSLVKELHITLDFNYQVKITSEGFVIGPTIGLLLGEKNQMYNLQYMEKYNDRFEEYGRYGGLIIAFSSRSIDWDKRIAYGMIYNPTQKIWKYGSAPIPSTIYRRNFHQNENRINQLKELTNHQLFNSYHFKKSDLYLLQDEPVICNHLPKTHLLTDIEELITFLHEEMKIILKPAHLSRGRGIFILELNEKYAGYMLYDYRKKYRVQHLIQDKHALIEMLKSLNILDRNYIFQTYIPLLKVNERPFDIRVVMQKANVKEWKCLGIECRVAGENEDLTNIARGGSAMTLEEVVNQSGLSLSHSSVRENVLTLCHYFCKVMDKNREHFAEFGLDIALDENGYPWIIEANIFPSFKGFKKMDYDTYLKIRYQPIFYAVNLQGFNVTKEGILDEVYNQSKLYLE